MPKYGVCPYCQAGPDHYAMRHYTCGAFDRSEKDGLDENETRFPDIWRSDRCRIRELQRLVILLAGVANEVAENNPDGKLIAMGALLENNKALTAIEDDYCIGIEEDAPF